MSTASRFKTLGFFLLIHLAGFSADAGEMRFKSQAVGRGAVVLLGDVAEVRHDDVQLAAALAQLELFPAPGGDQARSVRQGEIRELLALRSVDLAAWKFSGADTVQVQGGRPGAAVPPAGIVPPAGTTRPLAETLPADFIAVATRPLDRNETLRESDVAWLGLREVDAAAVRGASLLHEPREVIGMETTRAIAAGAPIDGRALRRPIVVHRGELIQVTSLAPGVSVQTSARALENAALGDLLLVESPVNRQRYSARVTGVQQAEVYASGITVSSSPPRPAESPDRSHPRGKLLR